MLNRISLGSLVCSAVLLVAGCMTTKPEQGSYSGWLKDYSDLSEVKTTTGATAMRWTSPDLHAGQYSAVMLDPVVFYPAAQTSKQVSMNTLNDIPNYLRQRVRQELNTVLPVVNTPGPGVLRIRAAITAVETPIEGLQAYEVIPIALVFAGVSTAAGTRDRNTLVYMEATLTDALSGKLLGKVVRKGIGETLENKKDQLTVNDVKPVLDSWAKDAAGYVRTTVK